MGGGGGVLEGTGPTLETCDYDIIDSYACAQYIHRFDRRVILP